jgi:hypothetical protein
MTSRVRVDVPSSPIARTSDMRENFSIIKTELEALQDVVFGSLPQNSPEFTGLAVFESLASNGPAILASISSLYTQTPTLTAGPGLSNLSGNLKFVRYPDNRIWITGTVVFDYTNVTPGQIYQNQIVAADGLITTVRPDRDWIVPSIIFGAGMYAGLIYVAVNGSVYLAFASDRNAVVANVTGVGATLYANGCYPLVGP